MVLPGPSTKFPISRLFGLHCSYRVWWHIGTYPKAITFCFEGKSTRKYYIMDIAIN